MARYRQFLCAFWDDPDVEEYSKDKKLLYALFFTNKSTTESGIYPLTIKKMSICTGIQQNRIKAILQNGIKNIYYDWQHKIIFVAKFIKHNFRGSPLKLRQSIAGDMKNYPTSLWKLFKKEYPDLYDVISKENKDLIKSLESNTKVSLIMTLTMTMKMTMKK